jgi:hypothetical protein
MTTVLVTGATDGLGRRDRQRAAPGDLHADQDGHRNRVTPRSALEEGLRATFNLVRRVDVSGRSFNGEHEARADAQAYDPAARARLRELSEGYLGGELSAGPPL